MDGETPAPPDLQLAWNCERYSCLPDAGGYMDQRYALTIRMLSLSNVYTAYSRYRNARGAQIHNLSESDRRILRQLKDMGMIFRA